MMQIKKLLKGQAFFFQGLGLFSNGNTLWRCTSGTSSANSRSEDLFVKRNTTSECIQQIVSDLDSAANDLPSFGPGSGSNDGHVHKGTALAVKGRVLLYYASPQFDPGQTQAGRWQAAYDANKEAKDYLESEGFGLYPDLFEIWFDEMNKEDIFVRRYDYTPNNSESWNNWAASTRPLDVSQGATGGNRPALEIVNAYPMKDGKCD